MSFGLAIIKLAEKLILKYKLASLSIQDAFRILELSSDRPLTKEYLREQHRKLLQKYAPHNARSLKDVGELTEKSKLVNDAFSLLNNDIDEEPSSDITPEMTGSSKTFYDMDIAPEEDDKDETIMVKEPNLPFDKTLYPKTEVPKHSLPYRRTEYANA